MRPHRTSARGLRQAKLRCASMGSRSKSYTPHWRKHRFVGDCPAQHYTVPVAQGLCSMPGDVWGGHSYHRGCGQDRLTSPCQPIQPSQAEPTVAQSKGDARATGAVFNPRPGVVFGLKLNPRRTGFCRMYSIFLSCFPRDEARRRMTRLANSATCTLQPVHASSSGGGPFKGPKNFR